MAYRPILVAFGLIGIATLTAAGCGAKKESFSDVDGGDGNGDSSFASDPDSCEAARASNSYVGCDAWPTAVANVAWSVFDFAVVVANAGDKPANVTVDRAGEVVATAVVPPNSLQKIYLPWIPELKGKDADYCGVSLSPLPKSVRANGGAYHLKSDRPITTYQFNALEYAPVGGPAKKDWTSCPANLGCPSVAGCFSYSNDASLLLPTHVLTGTYRVAGVPSSGGNQAYFAVTATENDTKVTVLLSPTAGVLEGGGLKATPGRGTLEFSMNAGDVVEVAGAIGGDLSGSLVKASHPVQVIAGHPCTSLPNGIASCDHVEESVLPAETLGKHYFVEQPSGPTGGIPGHVVRFYGNVDGTKLTYPQGAPPKAPKTINAGDVVELGVVKQDFEVVGDQEFAVVSFLMGSQAVDPQKVQGDPSMSSAVAVEQYRSKYVFLAPDDYDANYVDAVQPMDATLVLDGRRVETLPLKIGGSTYGVNRIRLADLSKGGAHVIESTAPFGVQVLGYGKYTSYKYPAGLDLERIAPTPVK